MLSQWLISWGFTRDSATWFWSRLVSGAALLLAAGPLEVLDPYFSDHAQRWIVLACVVVMWLSGKYDSSPLPGGRR